MWKERLATWRELLELADGSLGGDYTIIVGFVFWFIYLYSRERPSAQRWGNRDFPPNAGARAQSLARDPDPTRPSEDQRPHVLLLRPSAARPVRGIQKHRAGNRKGSSFSSCLEGGD